MQMALSPYLFPHHHLRPLCLALQEVSTCGHLHAKKEGEGLLLYARDNFCARGRWPAGRHQRGCTDIPREARAERARHEGGAPQVFQERPCAHCQDQGSEGGFAGNVYSSHTHTYIRTHTRTHTHTQTQTHKHKHTHTNTQNTHTKQQQLYQTNKLTLSLSLSLTLIHAPHSHTRRALPFRS
jgi:hypothetical protein